MTGAALSRAVVVAAIVAVALTLNGQENCPSPAEPVLHWVGQASGCTAENALPCTLNETIVFSGTPAGGGSYPECVTYLWDFDDGETSSVASPSHAFVANGAFFVQLRVRVGTVDAVTVRQVFVAETVVPIVERFSASATTIRRGETVVLSWSTRNATSVLIDGVHLDATVKSHAVSPLVTNTYTLTAFGAAAFVISKPPVTVVVIQPRRRAATH